jgi:hypothetical protein
MFLRNVGRNFNELHDIISQNIVELSLTTTVSTSNPTNIYLALILRVKWILKQLAFSFFSLSLETYSRDLIPRFKHAVWKRIQVNLSLCLTKWALCHEGVWGSGCIDPHILASALSRGEWSASRPGRFTLGDSNGAAWDYELTCSCCM